MRPTERKMFPPWYFSARSLGPNHWKSHDTIYATCSGRTSVYDFPGKKLKVTTDIEVFVSE